MKKIYQYNNLKAFFLFVAFFIFGCSKDAGVTPVTPELSILGKWQLLVSRSIENGKSTYEYVGKSGDFLEITNNDFIRYDNDGSKEAFQYKVIEKNKKIAIIGSTPSGGDDLVEIRNLTSSSMTLYQEYVKNNITYINYIDLKK
jgi:hypothetical protein